jgi:hypothetical protein
MVSLAPNAGRTIAATNKVAQYAGFVCMTSEALSNQLPPDASIVGPVRHVARTTSAMSPVVRIATQGGEQPSPLEQRKTC